MKKKNLNLLLVILFLAAGPGFALSRQNEQVKTNDKIVLTTDRSIYVSGEQVNFSALFFSTDNSDLVMKSLVLYCELISPDGTKIASNKYTIGQSGASGCILVPADLITGTYYLRAYTKQMRNYGPGTYGYKQIRIVNPGRDEVMAGDNKEQTGGEQILQVTKDPLADLLAIAVEKNAYAFGDSIKFTVSSKKDSFPTIKSLSLSVAPEAATSASVFVPALNENHTDGTNYFPETRGLSLTGKLTEGSKRNPVAGKRINLSIIGEGRDFMAVRSDSSGCFFLALPDYSGTRDLFLCAEKTPSADLKIWVDNDFCTLPVHLPSPVFSLSVQERQVVQNMALNMQINSHFYLDTLDKSANTKQTERTFYGEPTTVLYLDQFVQLPTLEEYFNELPGQVKVRKRMGEKYFKVIGPQDLSFYDPLVLVDWVAVDETDKILAVAPQNISRIEIVNQAYVKGEITYGGIISIISKKGDFAGIDLPSTGIFINYRFLADDQCQVNNPHTGIYPDSRNTLLWKPSVILQNDAAITFVLTAPETPGRYSIVMEGVKTNGQRFSTNSVFEVKQ